MLPRTLRCLTLLGFLFFCDGSMAANSKQFVAHDFSFTSIEGDPLSLSSFSGKAVLIVNTASQCGFTKQYADLQELWSRYRTKGFVVLGVPSNDFGGQEPGNEQSIRDFCEITFDVDFPMTSKARVKGPNAHAFYKWAEDSMGFTAKPRWNFHKYLILPNGKLADWFSSATNPVSGRVIKAVEAALPSDL